ncbi:MAG: hypothetical protein H7842_02475 [Gammaproteobacteria bacterium SHHR-1]
MMIDVHLPDEALAKLATLIAERLAEELQKQQPKPTYPAPTEAEVVWDQN